MAAVATVDYDIPIGQTEHLYVGSIALDNSYPTGGEVLDLPANTRLVHLDAQPTAGYTFEFVPGTQALKVYRGDNANASPAPGVEVANAVDLSALTAIRFMAIGA